uniref:Uncharacterized protein n=1 Tax=Oryza meridionalis TaxID=40149 RepID=A0A0E0CYM5_9ORYZ
MDPSGIYSAGRAGPPTAREPYGPAHSGPFRTGLAQPFCPLGFRPFVPLRATRGEGIMAAAHAHPLSLAVLPSSPAQATPPPLFLRYAALRRGGRCGGATRPLRLTRLRRGRAAAAGVVDAPMEQAEAMMRVAADDDSVTATVVSVLLTVAFVGLSILTIGVIYLSVTDFLQKREREKFEREEAERQKEEARKKRAKARGRKRKLDLDWLGIDFCSEP